MDSRESTLFSLLDGSKQYTIPHYQRLYSWDFKQVEALFADVVKLAKNLSARHFVGSIVYVSHPAKASGINNFVVIDGQQRLTTLSMLLLAVIDSLKLTDGDVKRRLNRTIRNSDESPSSDEYLKLKLTRQDNTSYRQIVHSISSGEPLNPDGSKVHKNFKHLVNLLAEADVPADSVWEAITRLDIVYISLEKGKDDPQAIFESLNSTGKNLSSTDLIRNYVLMDQEQAVQENLYENYWCKIEELFADRKDTEFDEFTRAHLAFIQEKYPKKTDVYDQFKASIRLDYDKGQNAQDVLGAFRDSAKKYAFVHWQQDSDTSSKVQTALNDYRQMGLRLLHPLLLEYATKNIQNAKYDPDAFFTALTLLESYLVRRIFIGLRSNSLDGSMATIFSMKHKSNLAGVDALADAMLSLKGKARFPRDEEFTYKGLTMELYNSAAREHILKKLERTLDPKGLGLSARVSIEHILPQKLNKAWEASLGDNAVSIRDRLVHTIGNLTLTPYNGELGQRTFQEKIHLDPGGFKASKIALSSSILGYQSWGEAEISGRGELLMEYAKKAWPMPRIWSDNYREIQSEVDKESLTLTDLLIAELIEPDDEIVWFRRQSNETHRARVTSSGTIIVSDGDEFETPTAATRAFTSSSYNGWKEWRHKSEDGATLDELRNQAAEEAQ
jgi:uncharacterized protein with ParB-like and HNH nuclease domain